MNVELINTGSELMLGLVLNSHLGAVSERLMARGAGLARQVTVPDGDAVRDVLREAWERADVVILTGGLGPTSDDLTRDIVAEVFGVPLEFSEEAWAEVEERFVSRGMKPPELAKVQAMVPRGGRWLSNRVGTAPGLYFGRDGKHLFCLPGPPRELIAMLEGEVLPVVEAMLGGVSAVPEMRQVRLLGIGESEVQNRAEEKLRGMGGFEIGYCARPGEVDLRLVGKDVAKLDEAVEWLAEEFADRIYTKGFLTMEQVVVELALERGVKLATAESCTGGLIAHRLTNVPGASGALDRGWVTYSNEAKQEELGVQASTLEAHGAVSEETAGEMAAGALERSGADVAVAVTGIAGPGGGTETKPVGLVFIAVAWGGENGGVWVERRNFRRERMPFKEMVSQVGLDLVRRAILRNF